MTIENERIIHYLDQDQIPELSMIGSSKLGITNLSSCSPNNMVFELL